MGGQAPEGLLDIHMNLLWPPGDTGDTEDEGVTLAALATFKAEGFGYILAQLTRPQTIGYALLESPVALAGWMLDHDTDSYYRISAALVDGRPTGNLTRDNVLDDITLYWLTGTGASAARAYWELGRATALAAGHAGPEVSLPVGFTTFPDEIYRAHTAGSRPRTPTSLTSTRPTGACQRQPKPDQLAAAPCSVFSCRRQGGHFAAWEEEPELFTTEVRAAFRSLR